MVSKTPYIRISETGDTLNLKLVLERMISTPVGDTTEKVLPAQDETVDASLSVHLSAQQQPVSV